MSSEIWKRENTEPPGQGKGILAEGSTSAQRRVKLYPSIVTFIFINYQSLAQCDRMFDNTELIFAQGEAGLPGTPVSPGQKGDKGEPVRNLRTLSG